MDAEQQVIRELLVVYLVQFINNAISEEIYYRSRSTQYIAYLRVFHTERGSGNQPVSKSLI